MFRYIDISYNSRRNKIGRPLNKRYIGDATDKIKISHYFRVGGSETAGDEDTYIVRQRSGNKFLIADTSGGWSEVLTLVDKDAGALAEGEFRIDANTAEGDLANVVRLYNRTVRVSGPEKMIWTVGAPAADLTITGITQADPAVVTVADTSTLAEMDVITISGVVGMTEINDRQFTVNVLDGTTFELVGEDSTGHTAYVSGGTISGVGNDGGIDIQS